ncbi:MAG: nitroreductase family protein [Deltaproteobacteria bacterium]|nr:nitroreductase family protein [Deltaproteobacteria bacterium]
MSETRVGGAYDELLALVRARRSVRRFLPEPVSQEDVRRLLEAARWAPSPTNRQPWRFAVVRDAERKAGMREAVAAAARAAATAVGGMVEEGMAPYAAMFEAFEQAPVVVAVLARRPSRVAARLGAGLSDTERAALAGDLPAIGAAIQNFLLAAHALGLGACWLSGPLLAAPDLRAILGGPPTLDLVALIPVGRPAETPAAPPRRDVDQLLVGTKETGPA